MKLYPALKIDGKIIQGESDDSHNTLAIEHDLPKPKEETRGFTSTGKDFLSRKQALGFLKKYDIKTFRKLPTKAHYSGLHSEHLAKAYGIPQKPEAMEIRESSPKVIEQAPATKPETYDLSEKTAVVYDRGGLYLYCAEKLSQSYKKVMYYLADADAYPTSQKYTIGTGITGVKRIHDFYKHVDEADIIYFFDCYDGEMAHWLKSQGKKVFSSLRGEQIEIDKVMFLETLEELELPCPKTYLAEGMKELCDYLKEHDGETLFMKNLHRGDFESRKFTSMAQSRPFLDDLKKRLGSASDTIEVLVQHKIEAECEVGWDGYQVNGEYTKNGIVGYEIKDKGFVGKVFENKPEILAQIDDAFSPVFKKLGYQGNYSTEIRITEDGTPYFIDATCRVPSPPGEAMCELYGNWAEATYQIACGEVPKLIPKAQYVAVIILTSSWYNNHELHVKFPAKIKEFVKLKNYTKRDGEYYCIPNGNEEFFGAVIAYGDSVEDATELCHEYAEMVEADEMDFDDEIFEDAEEAISKGEQFGINF